jgi:ATP-binding cassette, subfamily B, multidrug efflux pump
MGKIISYFMKKNMFTYIIGIIFMFTSSYIQTIFPRILGSTIDILKLESFESDQVIRNILLILSVTVGTFASTYIWRNLVIGNGRKLECYLRERLFGHFQVLSPEYYNRKKTGDLIAYAINDISAVRMTFGPAAAMSINGIVVCAASIYSMSRVVNLRLTIISLLPIPFIVFSMLKVGRIVQKRFRKVQESFASISDRVQENINGIRVIKAYVQEEKEVENFEKLSERMMDANLKMVRVSSLLSPLIEISFSISFALNLIIGGNMVLSGSITLGDFIAFNTYLAIIMRPVISFGRIINILQRGMASFKRLNEIFEIEPKILDGSAMLETDILGQIHIKDLNFSYPESEERALEGINIEVPRGRTLGIIGKTGSGKSTLANILLKLYNVESGKVFIDCADINDYTLKALRQGFGYVPQDNFLFSATIMDNIKFFKEEYSDEAAFEAARNSCIYESIENFPEGFNTLLGERGVNLSGGQKQRISIARAILKDPSVLILDDALSAVDAITEGEILSNLRRVRRDKTSIIIAHRISAVEKADEIVVLDMGKIVERGTHGELLGKEGAYYEIYSEQNRGAQHKFEA